MHKVPLVVHFLLVSLLVFHVSIYTTNSSSYFNEVASTIVSFFAPEFDDPRDALTDEIPFYTIQEVADEIANSVSQCQNLLNQSLTLITFNTSSCNGYPSLSFSKSYKGWTIPKNCSLSYPDLPDLLSSSHCLLPESPLGPFSINDIRLLQCALLSASCINLDTFLFSREISAFSVSVIEWVLTESFTLLHGAGQIIYSFDLKGFYSDLNQTHYRGFVYYSVCCLILILSLLSFFMNFIFLYKTYAPSKIDDYLLIGHKESKNSHKFSGTFFFCSFISDIFLLIYFGETVSGAFIQSKFLDPIFGILYSSAVLLRCISLTTYLQFSELLFLLTESIKRAFPNVALFIFSISPVYLGFSLFGFCLFGASSPLFGTVGQSAVTLFGALNGDAVADIFDSIYHSFPILSRLFIYCFISLFTYTVLNTFIIIVESAYYSLPVNDVHVNPAPEVGPFDSIKNSFEQQLVADVNHNLEVLKEIAGVW
ncbi:hypothetical protein RCL1_003826 [Eukaryota sp. TZLM3-RCL]